MGVEMKERLTLLLLSVIVIFVCVYVGYAIIEEGYTKPVEKCNEKYGIDKWEFVEKHNLDFYIGQEWVCVPKERT